MRCWRFTTVLTVCTALAACDGTSPPRQIMGPSNASTLFDEAAADNGLALTPDGPYDQVFAAQDPSAQQGAIGSQALGHIGFAFAPPSGSIVDEKYEFAALATELAPSVAAMGELEVHLQTVAAQFKVHADVICMTVVGTQARIAARIELLFVNGVPVPPGEQYTVWTISDNGEGLGTPDTASLMFFTLSPAVALFHCSTGFALPLIPNQEGNVQVFP